MNSMSARYHHIIMCVLRFVLCIMIKLYPSIFYLNTVMSNSLCTFYMHVYIGLELWSNTVFCPWLFRFAKHFYEQNMNIRKTEQIYSSRVWHWSKRIPRKSPPVRSGDGAWVVSSCMSGVSPCDIINILQQTAKSSVRGRCDIDNSMI